MSSPQVGWASAAKEANTRKPGKFFMNSTEKQGGTAICRSRLLIQVRARFYSGRVAINPHSFRNAALRLLDQRFHSLNRSFSMRRSKSREEARRCDWICRLFRHTVRKPRIASRFDLRMVIGCPLNV